MAGEVELWAILRRGGMTGAAADAVVALISMSEHPVIPCDVVVHAIEHYRATWRDGQQRLIYTTAGRALVVVHDTDGTGGPQADPHDEPGPEVL